MRIAKRLKYSFFVAMFLLLVHASQSTVFAQSLDFVPKTESVNTGENFTVSIAVDSKGKKAAGVGAELIYDPGYLAIVSVSPGKLFTDYPEASFDNKTGRADISGIVLSEDQQITGYGIFADVTFVAKKAGTSKVNFDFTPGATNDSNIAVTYEPGDILAEVGTLTVTAAGTSVVTDYPQSSLEEGAVQLTGEGATKPLNFVDKILISLGFKDEPVPTTPNTDPSQSQSSTTREGMSSQSSSVLKVALIVVFVILFFLLIYLIFKAIKNRKPTVVQDMNDKDQKKQ